MALRIAESLVAAGLFGSYCKVTVSYSCYPGVDGQVSCILAGSLITVPGLPSHPAAHRLILKVKDVS
ncbi:MAG: hypothetical protein H0Z39_00985 [Peptococcaceae bacterium]|nr:hypothetical protein [Peptococcaceae bacterium]